MNSIHKGKLTVLKISGIDYIIECECGNVFRRPARVFKTYTGRGCFKCRVKGENNPRYSHGGNTVNHAEYNSWRAMIERCTKEHYHRYDLYGGRGIKVADRWIGENGFANFLADMGKKPTERYSIDRIDRDGNYSPENCRWATQKEQMSHVSNNRLVTIGNTTKILADWCMQYGIGASSVENRVRLGWDYPRAITTPLNKTGVNFTNASLGRFIPRGKCAECGIVVNHPRGKFCSQACYFKHRWGFIAPTK
jgi:hypothetical protein